jgi:hypothetical protein
MIVSSVDRFRYLNLRLAQVRVGASADYDVRALFFRQLHVIWVEQKPQEDSFIPREAAQRCRYRQLFSNSKEEQN